MLAHTRAHDSLIRQIPNGVLAGPLKDLQTVIWGTDRFSSTGSRFVSENEQGKPVVIRKDPREATAGGRGTRR